MYSMYLCLFYILINQGSPTELKMHPFQMAESGSMPHCSLVTPAGQSSTLSLLV
uniref:Uncharacterized protein n=1 Tax=Anguilla anguilla TaxID=7936 RepID=A0A0E9V607_ANGAN